MTSRPTGGRVLPFLRRRQTAIVVIRRRSTETKPVTRFAPQAVNSAGSGRAPFGLDAPDSTRDGRRTYRTAWDNVGDVRRFDSDAPRFKSQGSLVSGPSRRPGLAGSSPEIVSPLAVLILEQNRRRDTRRLIGSNAVRGPPGASPPRVWPQRPRGLQTRSDTPCRAADSSPAGL